MSTLFTDTNSFLVGFHFGLGVARLQIDKYNAQKLYEDLLAIERGDLSLIESPAEIIADLEKLRGGAVSDETKAEAHKLFSERETDGERHAAKTVLEEIIKSAPLRQKFEGK